MAAGPCCVEAEEREHRAAVASDQGSLHRGERDRSECIDAGSTLPHPYATGRRLTNATKNPTGLSFAGAMMKVADRYSAARKIDIVLDNLSTHS